MQGRSEQTCLGSDSDTSSAMPSDSGRVVKNLKGTLAMQETTKTMLEAWAENINWAVPTHPSDMRRFYEFGIGVLETQAKGKEGS